MPNLNERKIQLPALQMRAEFQPDTINEEKRTVEVVWTTGASVQRSSFWSGESWMEKLSLKKEHVRMDFLNSGKAPLLAVHNQRELPAVVGVVESAWLTETEGRAIVRFSKRADVEPIFQDVKDKILRGISVGYLVHRFEKMPESDGEQIPTWEARDWEPKEISLVPIGADSGAAVRSHGNLSSECVFINTIAERGEKEKSMPEVNQTPAVQTPAPVDTKAIAQEATAAERKRVAEIQGLVRKLNLPVEFEQKLIADGTEVDAARAIVIDEVAKRSAAQPDTRAAHTVEAGSQDERMTMRQGMTDALLHRAMPQTFKVTDQARGFRGMSLLRLAEEIVGRGARGMSRSELAARAMSTGDFPIILNNVARKMLRAQYEIQPQTFKAWAQPGTLPDYREMEVDQFGAFSDLEKVPEGGEYKYGTIGEDREKIKVAKFGKIFAITEEVVVNDDLNAMSRALTAMSRAGARVESKIVYTDILVGNPAMADNVALFHADHGNLPSAATIPNGYAAARAALRKQKDLDGKDFLELEPGFLIVGPDKEEEALKVLNGTIVAAKVADVNVWRNSAAPIVEARITGNKWFLAAKNYDTVMYAYLEGMNGPEISEQAEFNSDVIKIKVKHVFGAKAIDYRGLVYNSGA